MSFANSNLHLSEQEPRPRTPRAAPIVTLVTAPLPPPSTWSDGALLANLLARQGCAWVEFSRRFDGLIRNCMSKILRRFDSVLSSADADDAHAMLMDRLLANDMYPREPFVKSAACGSVRGSDCCRKTLPTTSCECERNSAACRGRWQVWSTLRVARRPRACWWSTKIAVNARLQRALRGGRRASAAEEPLAAE